MIERPSPEMLAEARRTFDEAEYLAGLREIESGGGFRLEDFSDEIDRICHEKGQEYSHHPSRAMRQVKVQDLKPIKGKPLTITIALRE